MFMPGDTSWMSEKFANLQREGLDWNPPTLETANEPRCIMNGRPTIMLSANNYLNFTNHPRVVSAMIEATQKYGAGSGSVRAIAGTMDIHLDAEKKVAEFKGVESALIYSSGYTANVGLIPSLVQGPQDVIISDELNHASIIESCKLSGAKISIYKHNDMDDLADKIKKQGKNKFVITEGVFSMDGDVSSLKEITEISQKSNAITIVDDAHGDFVIGKDGKGTPEYFNVAKKIDLYISSLSKGLGSFGGYVAS